MYFDKKRGKNRYLVFGIADGFDFKVDPEKQNELWIPWEFSDHFYEGVCEYYENDDSVRC